MYSPSYGGRLLSRRGGSNVTRKCPPPDDLQSMMRSDAVSAETVIPRQCEGAKTPILCPCRSTEITGACPTGLRLLWSFVIIVSGRCVSFSEAISEPAETAVIDSKTSSDACLIFKFLKTNFFIFHFYKAYKFRERQGALFS